MISTLYKMNVTKRHSSVIQAIVGIVCFWDGFFCKVAGGSGALVNIVGVMKSYQEVPRYFSQEVPTCHNRVPSSKRCSKYTFRSIQK